MQFTVKILVQRRCEGLISSCRAREQRHRRMKLQVIRIRKDLVDGRILDERNQLTTLDQSLTESRVIQVGNRFINRRNRIVPRYLAVPEALQLRENEPHPMRSLCASAQF